MELVLSKLESPIGELVLVAGADGLCGLWFTDEGEGEAMQAWLARAYPGATLSWRAQPDLEAPLRAYFAGNLKAIDKMKVAPHGTPFQLRVWQALRRIPVGETWTYAQLAKEVGNPSATRAVGAANGRNPIALVVPCHRVVASSGRLGGYAGGLHRKEWLLRHEGAHLA
jgi:methylated-DNA-[protein]-cysteine S-methyltransferase